MSLAIALLFAAAEAQLVTVAPPRAQPVPATSWACTFETPDGERFRLSGRVDEIPAGWDPNRSRDTDVEGEGAPLPVGRYGMTGDGAGEYFREYQLTAYRRTERFNVNLMLRRGGAGVAHITRYVENDERQPYSYYAAGLCTSEFGGGPAPESPKP
jgi:predicted alpha/beta-fold hydrolase